MHRFSIITFYYYDDNNEIEPMKCIFIHRLSPPHLIAVCVCCCYSHFSWQQKFVVTRNVSSPHRVLLSNSWRISSEFRWWCFEFLSRTIKTENRTISHEVLISVSLGQNSTAWRKWNKILTFYQYQLRQSELIETSIELSWTRNTNKPWLEFF